MIDHESFSASQKLLHWLMAVCILGLLFVGVGMVSTIMPSYVPLVTLHKSLGIAILVLALLRLGLRLVLGSPPMPFDLPAPMRLAAKASHYALYALMIGMPLIGWGMMSAAAYPIVLVGGLRLPPILPPDPSLHAVLWALHSSLGYAFFALILMHIAASLFHALIRRDGVFEAMTSHSLRRSLR